MIKIAKREKHDRKDGHVLSDLELLSNLQHYGAATCLIDFTRNPLIALWFACQPHHKTENGETNPADGKIVAVNANHPEKFGIAEGGEKIEKFFPDKKLWKWIPPKQNHRIVAQQSVFVLGQSVIPEDEMLASYIIPHESKDSILLELQDRYGISAESLFCDFPGFAREVHGHDKEYHEWTVKDYFQFGLDNQQKGNYAAAIKDYDQAIILNPQYADAYNNRGNAKNNLGDYNAAVADYNEAIRLNPKYANAYNNRGNAKSNLGDYNAAVADYDEAIKLNPKYANAYYNRGIANFFLGNYDSAITDCDEAIRLNPKNAIAYYNRGVAKFFLGDKTGALKDFKKANEIDPEFKIPKSLETKTSEGKK